LPFPLYTNWRIDHEDLSLTGQASLSRTPRLSVAGNAGTPNPLLALDAHLTLAVAAGTILNVKSGRHIEIEQRTDGRRIWLADDEEPKAEWDSLTFTSDEIAKDATDLVFTIGLCQRCSTFYAAP
jgi:hypothetical protein